jgi:hypothetical protein
MTKQELDEFLKSRPGDMQADPDRPPLRTRPLPPRRPATEWGKPPQKASCPAPSDKAKAQQFDELMAKIDKRAQTTDEMADRLTRNRMGEKDPDWFKENPGDRLSRQERETLEKDFDRLSRENFEDLSKAIKLRNELYPPETGQPSLTPGELKQLGLTGSRPLRTGPGDTQVIPRTGPGDTQPLRGPGDTERLPQGRQP